MGWNSQNVTTLLIVNATAGGFSGVFVYSPIAGPGNLIQSIAGAAGTDSYGNAYLKGDTSYANDGFGTFTQENAGLLVFGNGTFPTVAAGAASIDLQTTGKLLITVGSTGPNITMAQAQGPGSAFVADSWHNLSLNAGFSGVAGQTPQYEFEPVNGGRVRLRGVVSLTANEANGTVIATLPAGYVPPKVTSYVLPNNLSGGTGTNAAIQVDASGNIKLNTAGSIGNFVQFDGVTIPLD